MYFEDTEDLLPDYHEDDEDGDQNSVGDEGEEGEPQHSVASREPSLCSRGHRSTLILRTRQGGAICLICFSNLVGDPLSPTLHVSYALSQLSLALSQPPFLRSLLAFHPRLLVSPLVRALSSFDDDAIAAQILDLVAALCDSADSSLRGDFVARVSDLLASGALAWSRRQVYTLHCLGILLKKDNPYTHIKDKYGLISNLVGGLQLPRNEIRGEILFVLYRLSVLHYALENEDGTDTLLSFCPKLLHLSLDALIKIQSDDVRLNCVALLTVLAQRGFFGNAYADDAISMNTYEADSLVQGTENGADGSPMNVLFAEAIKGPLLSTDSQVQISTVNLLFYYVSWEGTSIEDIEVLVEENIADYVFEILRLSECKDPVVNSCLQVLDLLSKAKQAFKQRLVVGFATLIPVLQYIAEIPFHPVQVQTLRLIWNCVSDCPGFPSASQIKELIVVLTRMLEMHADGEMGMLPETFMLVCSIFVSLLKSPSSPGTYGVAVSVKEASQHALLSCLSVSENNSCQLLHSLHLLKEVYAYCHEENSADSSNSEVRNCILDLCTVHLLPWFVTFFKEIEEEIVLGLLETFHSILLWDSDIQASKFADTLASFSWFSLSFGCLGLFPTEVMKEKVYLILGSLVDIILGNDSGQSIKDAALCLPSDPIDLLFLLRQKSSYNLELSSSQSAILTILYASTLYDERLADNKLVLASLEDYILAKASDFGNEATDLSSVMRLLYLYGLYRGLAKVSYQIPYNPEAERILFQLVNKNEWDLVSARIHPISLKWMFQQEGFCEPLSDQIMKFCQSNISHGSDITSDEKNSCIVNIQAIAELVASGDNYAARILVGLLTKLVKEEQEQDSYIISLVNLVTRIVNISPSASNELCLNNVGNAIYSLFSEKNCKLSSDISTPVLVFVFNLLSSVHSETLSDDEIWVAVIMKLMEYITAEGTGRWTRDNLYCISILSLVLNHSTDDALVEASKTILFNSYLVSTIDCMVHEACEKGPSLVDHDEGTSYGERLVFVLLLNYFSLKSLCAVLPGCIDWQSFFNPPDRTLELSLIGIPCHDLCRLLYFGSPLVKLAASHCLLELFSGISDQGNTECELKCTLEYLMSMITVLQGMVLYSDHRVALNCSLCMSLIFGCEMLDMLDMGVTGKNNWSKLIIEELAVSLSAPSLASKSFIHQHKPAIYVAIALLKLEKVPGWMSSVFDEPCISGMIKTLTASNVTSDIVVLFRELLNCGLLKTEQITSLNQILQACRKRLFTDSTKDDGEDRHIKKAITASGDLGEICEYLICLMSSKSSQGRDFGELYCGRRSLLEEIELFFRSSMIEDEN